MGPPFLICDDLFIWTAEYVFLVKNGLIKIDELLLENIEKNNFKIPVLNLLDFKLIEQTLTDCGFPEFSDLRTTLAHLRRINQSR